MKNLHLIILALLALLIGCSKQFLKDDNLLTITAVSSDFETKATETAFEAGDKIGVFLENNTPNLRYETSDGSTWNGFGNLTQFKAGDNVIAYYPYSSTATNQNAIEVSSGVDFMICPKTPLIIADNKANAALKFKHILSKLVAKMAMPEEIAGVKTVSLDSIILKNIFKKGVIDLATEKITGLTDIGDVKVSGNEAIIIPQTVQKLEIVFKMANGTFDRLAYNTPILLEGGKKTTLTAISNDDLYFTSNLNLSSGEAQTALPLSFYVAPGRTWTLKSSEPWLTFSATTGVGSATVKVNVAQNAGMPRTAIITLTDDKQAVATQSPMQYYLRTVTIAGTKWTTRNLTGTIQGQTSGFTLAANPQDFGMFWKWGSLYLYNRISGKIPQDHWSNDYLTMGATSPASSITSDMGYDYVNLGGCPTPGDPCKALGAYRTPTRSQWQALCKTGSIQVTLNKTKGLLFGTNSSPSTISSIPDNCIFIPTAGFRDGASGDLIFETIDSRYWSSTALDPARAYDLAFNDKDYISPNYPDGRGGAFSVRCVAQ